MTSDCDLIRIVKCFDLTCNLYMKCIHFGVIDISALK